MIRSGSWLSCFQSGYLAHALNRQFVSAMEFSFVTKIGPGIAHPDAVGWPDVKLHPLQIGMAWQYLSRCICFSRAEAGYADEIYVFHTAQTADDIGKDSTGCQASNFPGQSERLCGHANHVAACCSHSAGMR